MVLEAVPRDLNEAVHLAVYRWSVVEVLYQAIGDVVCRAIDEAVDHAVYMFVDEAVDQAVHWALRGAVLEAVGDFEVPLEEPPPPGLMLYLGSVV